MTAKKTTTKSEPKATKPAEPRTLKDLVCLWSETLDLGPRLSPAGTNSLVPRRVLTVGEEGFEPPTFRV